MELARLLSTRLGLKSLTRHETGVFSVDAVYQNLDKHVAKSLKEKSKNGVNAVYAYEDGAYQSFTTAKQQDIQCLYDLPIGYWRAAHRLLQHEIELWPDWKATLQGFDDSDAKLQRKDVELALADRIFVATYFSMMSAALPHATRLCQLVLVCFSPLPSLYCSFVAMDILATFLPPSKFVMVGSPPTFPINCTLFFNVLMINVFITCLLTGLINNFPFLFKLN